MSLTDKLSSDGQSWINVDYFVEEPSGLAGPGGATIVPSLEGKMVKTHGTLEAPAKEVYLRDPGLLPPPPRAVRPRGKGQGGLLAQRVGEASHPGPAGSLSGHVEMILDSDEEATLGAWLMTCSLSMMALIRGARSTANGRGAGRLRSGRSGRCRCWVP